MTKNYPTPIDNNAEAEKYDYAQHNLKSAVLAGNHLHVAIRII